MLGIAEFGGGLLDGLVLVLLSLVVASVPWGLVVLRATRCERGDPVVVRAASLLERSALGLALCQAGLLAVKLLLLRSYLGSDALALFGATAQARAAVARLLLALVLAVAARRLRARTDDPSRWAFVGATVLAILVAGAWLTHATSRLEDRGWLMALTVAHQAATGAWVGGVLHLALLWRRGRADASTAEAASFAGAVDSFSRVALPAVALSIATGVPLAAAYLGSWQALVGSGPGSLLLGKLALVGLALCLGGSTFLAARRASRPSPARRAGGRDAAFVSVEALLLVGALFAAASLASQPPAVDTVETQATLAEVATTFAPKWPTLHTPSVATKRAAATDPLAVVGWQRSSTEYSWSNFSHNVAGLVVLPMAVCMLLAPRARWARHWPLGLVVLAAFVFLRSCASDGIWPLGTLSPFASDSEGFQHRLAAGLALALGLVEWRARTADRPDRRAWVFPMLAAAGGILLVTHAHTAFEGKASYLVQVTHVAMGVLALMLAAARLLELRVAGPLGRLGGTIAGTAMLLIAFVLMFYREANVVVSDAPPPDTITTAPAVRR